MDRETVRDVRMAFEDFLAALADTRKCFRDSGQWADEDVVPGENYEERLEFLAEDVRNQISALSAMHGAVEPSEEALHKAVRAYKDVTVSQQVVSFLAMCAALRAAYAIDRPTPVVDREAVRRVVTAAFRASNNTGPDADQRLQAFVDDILALATTRDEVIEGLVEQAMNYPLAANLHCGELAQWLRSHKGSVS